MRRSTLPEIVSGMNSIDSLEGFLLDLLALRICKNQVDLRKALKSTLYSATNESQDEFVDKAISSLISRQMINVVYFLNLSQSPNFQKNVEITELGIAASQANLLPTQAVSLYNALMRTLDQGNRQY